MGGVWAGVVAPGLPGGASVAVCGGVLGGLFFGFGLVEGDRVAECFELAL